jgi:trehalose synthase
LVDYYEVDPRLGTLGDFVDFVRTADDRGLRVIADLVANHTSDEHAWFKAAADRSSPFHNFYVWRDDEPEGEPAELVFPDVESSLWTHHEPTQRWYHHRFYSCQPDLNVANPAVRDEIRKIASFWLQLGLSGFRVDAVPYLLEMELVPRPVGAEVADDPHAAGVDWLRDLSSYLSRRDGSTVLVGEVNVEADRLRRYFGGDKGDGLDMAFNFVLNQALFLALVRMDSGPLDVALDALPEIPERSQWVNFVRNHDELTLDKLSASDREEVFAALAPDEGMRLYGRGIRRRLPTMLAGDRRRIELVYSLVFTLPGSPALLWGEEIGLAENLELDDRLAVRVPMQWSAEQNGGFSPASPERLVAPVRAEGPYGYEAVNVANQRHDPDSLLSWIERLIRARKECPEIGWGRPTRLHTGERCVFAHRFDWDDRVLVFAHNLSDEPQTIELREGVEDIAALDDLMSGDDVETSDGRLALELGPSGYRWFRERGKAA